MRGSESLGINLLNLDLEVTIYRIKSGSSSEDIQDKSRSSSDDIQNKIWI